MVTKKELKKALKAEESVKTDKKPVDAKLSAEKVFKKFKEITEDRGSMPL